MQFDFFGNYIYNSKKGEFIMKFSEKLNSYLEEFKITPKELSKMSNLSPTLISRYLNGKRTPSLDSEYLQKLIDTLYAISSSSNNRY